MARICASVNVAFELVPTLLPEIGTQVAQSHDRQRAQYRITFERPEGKSGPQVGGIGLSFVEGSFEPADVDQKIYWCGFACVGMYAHGEEG